MKIFARTSRWLLLGVLVLAGPAFAQSLKASAATANSPKIGAKFLYPKPSLTRGQADTLNRADLIRAWPCPVKIRKPSCSYSQAHRDVAAMVKKRIYAEYGVDPRPHVPGEIDHFYPLCAGGSNDLTNLWFQPATNIWNGRNYGHHEKDDLEAWVCHEIKIGALDPREAFDRMTVGWVKFYEEVKPAGENWQGNEGEEPAR